MPKKPTKFPIAFIGHSFKKPFPVDAFRAMFKSLPISVLYGNTDIETKHLLTILKSHIKKVDFCIFDLTYWNPNVALELGMAEGLSVKPGKNYYVLLDSKRSKDVPSDIKGYQRLEYSRYDYSTNGLGGCLLQIIKKCYWSEKIHGEIKRTYPDDKKVEKYYIIGMKILGHFKEYTKLMPDNMNRICKGFRLTKVDRENIQEILVKLTIAKRVSGNLVLNRKCALSEMDPVYSHGMG